MFSVLYIHLKLDRIKGYNWYNHTENRYATHAKELGSMGDCRHTLIMLHSQGPKSNTITLWLFNIAMEHGP